MPWLRDTKFQLGRKLRIKPFSPVSLMEALYSLHRFFPRDIFSRFQDFFDRQVKFSFSVFFGNSHEHIKGEECCIIWLLWYVETIFSQTLMPKGRVGGYWVGIADVLFVSEVIAFVFKRICTLGTFRRTYVPFNENCSNQGSYVNRWSLMLTLIFKVQNVLIELVFHD